MTDDEFWSRVFPPADAAKVAAGVAIARGRREARILTGLDPQLDEPGCEVPGCSETAVRAAYCRHKGTLGSLYCAPHREQLLAQFRHVPAVCLTCGRLGPVAALIRFVRIFTTRSQP